MHLRNYHKKLLSSYGMDSPLLPEEHTSQLSTSTKHSQDFDEHNHSLHRSTFSQHGSRRRSSKQRPRQPRNTFKASEATTSTWVSTNRRSTIHVSKGLSEAEKGTMGMLTDEKDFPLQEKSLSASYNRSPIHTMDSTVKLRSVSASQRFCMQGNSLLLRQFRGRWQLHHHPSSIQNGLLPQRSSHSTHSGNEWITNMSSRRTTHPLQLFPNKPQGPAIRKDLRSFLMRSSHQDN